jgi:hypothetical protein
VFVEFFSFCWAVVQVTSDAKLSKVRDVVGKGTEPAPPARGGPAAAARRGLTPSSPKTPVGAGGRAVGPFSAPASPDKASHIARSHSTGEQGLPPDDDNFSDLFYFLITISLRTLLGFRLNTLPSNPIL